MHGDHRVDKQTGCIKYHLLSLFLIGFKFHRTDHRLELMEADHKLGS